ncbi:MAG TPA: UDP-N-acetylglucosamine--N-acetylmuramyl-(pentapeptide) pyrophosphoryl-undecaprenol N-acetylglucosamine transferase [Patescibacteria group bacterium]
MNSKRVVFTGGHAGTTAIAVIEEVKRQNLGWDIYWIGPKKTFEGKAISSYHSRVFPRLGVVYKGINTGRLQRRLSIWTIPSILRIPFGFIQAFRQITAIKPSAVVSFGGYVAFPVAAAAWILGIPVIIHEQTMAAGLANKLTSFFARKIALARKASEEYYSKGKTEVTGNPIMSAILSVKPKTKIGNPPTIYITGGSSGAQAINRAVNSVLEKILLNYKVIHQTGDLDFSFFEKRKESMDKKLKDRYEVFGFMDPSEIYKVYEKADIIISRAGANTVSEIMTIGIPSILIPIPWARYDEQTKNADLAKVSGIARVLKQNVLAGQKLLDEIEGTKKEWVHMVNSMDRSIGLLDKGASLRVVDIIKRYIK